MTPNHGYTPTDDQRREQATPGQQPPQQPPQGVPQPTPQPQTQQGQPQSQPPQQQQQGQPTQQLGQPTQQLGQATQQFGQATQQLGQTTQQFGQSQGIPQAHQQQQSQPGHQQMGQPQAVQQTPQTGQQTPQAGGVQQQYAQSSSTRQRQGSQQPLLKPLRVNEIITEDVVTAQTDTPIRTVVAKMSESDVGSVVVVEEDRPIGVITDRKVALALEEIPDIAQRTAEELVQGDVFTADPSMSIFDAIQVMSDEGIRRLPIVDDNGALRGIVTLDDAMVLLGGVVSEVADTIESQSPRL